jgi:hypothetical protein
VAETMIKARWRKSKSPTEIVHQDFSGIFQRNRAQCLAARALLTPSGTSPEKS